MESRLVLYPIPLLFQCIRALLLYCVVSSLAYANEATEQGCWAHVAAQAQQLATKPYEATTSLEESVVQKLNYDGYRQLRFKPEKTIWRSEQLPFQLEPLPPGLSFRRPVGLYSWEQGQATPITFNADYFEASELLTNIPSAQAGFTGFRVLYPLKKGEFHNEFFVFQGASYFRARSANQVYGVSVRGLGINTDLEGHEEFPDYRSFWIEKPQRDATTLTICALLDSPSVAGVTEFKITPDTETSAEVKTEFFWRTTDINVGISPLTSMFFHGENATEHMGDYRPEVHDSDGLLVETQEGFEWHPLAQPASFMAHELSIPTLKGFGLLQRDRNFDHYQDLEAQYHLRTSVWVTPLNDWGAGALRLIHFPTNSDVLDNVVTYWQPERLTPQQVWRYRLTWLKQDPKHHLLGKVNATRIANKNVDSLPNQDGLLRFFIDFKDIPTTTEPIEAEVGQSGNLNIQVSHIQVNPHLPQGWRVVLAARPEAGQCDQPSVLLARLKAGKKPVSETWVYPLSKDLCQRN